MRALAVLALLARVADAAPSCTVDGVVPVAFGTYNPLDSNPLDVQGSVSYKCTSSIAITIDISTGGSGDYTNRKMQRTAGATTPMAYNLYKDPTRLLVWGTGVATSVIALASLVSIAVPIFGRIPAKQSVDSGSYQDTVTITINF